VLLAAGCSTTPKAPRKFTFFPAPPDEPRIQFLTSFSSDADLRRGLGFTEYLTGRAAGPNPLVKPYGLALQDGRVYVCDTVLSAIEVFDLAKKRARYFAPRGEGRLQTPINITIDRDGTRYIADTGRNQVVLLAPDGAYLGAMGTQDEMKPTDVAVSADRLYVTDLKHHAVRVYNKADRKLLFTIPRGEAAGGKGKLFQPTNLALDGQGHLVVSDTGGFSVQVYDTEGNFVRSVGQQGIAPGLFALPKGVATDHEGHILVVDARTQVVQMFDPAGKLLMYFGQPGSSDAGELYLPAAVKVDYDNVGLFQSQVAPGLKLEYLILVSSQLGNHKINVYGFVRKK